MKRKIRLLYFLMFLALSFLLGFQIFWIQKSIDQESQRFEKELLQAVKKANEKFIGDAVVTFFTTDDKTKQILLKPYLFDPQKGGLTVNVSEDSTFDDGKKHIQSKKRIDAHFFQIDSPASFGQQYSFSTSEDDTVMIQEEDIDVNLPLVELYKNYDQLLTEELQAIGIEQFAYAYRDDASQGFYFVSTKGFEEYKKTTSIIFERPMDLREETTLFNLFIPDTRWFAWKNLWQPILSSIILVLLILTAFIYATWLIFNQKKTSEIKNDFINNMTHEFKTPISTVSLALEALLKFNIREDESKSIQYLEIAKSENTRLGQMVEKVLNIAASDQKTLKLNMEKVHMHTIIRQVVANMQMQIKESNAEVIFNFQTENDLIVGDSEHLKNVIYNLIDNALKYNQQTHPKVEITTDHSSNNLMMNFKDNGIGIPLKYQSLIFEKFYRVPTGNIHNVKGFGLGLNYVSMVVHRHLGEMHLSSKEGQGTTFYLSIPLYNASIK